MKLWFLLGSGVAAMVMGAASMLMMSSGAATPAVRVTRGEIHDFIDEQGQTRLERTHLIATPIPGRVELVSLTPGDKVQKGQVVARISTQQLEQEVAEAQAQVDQFKASLRENNDVSVETTAKKQSEAFVDSMRLTVEAAQKKMTSGRKRMVVSDRMLDRARRLNTTGAQSQERLDLAELASVEGQVNYQENVLTWEAAKSVLTATAMLPKIIDEWMQRKSLTAQVIEKQLAEAEAKLKLSKLRQERGAMKSPVDGVVLDRLVHSERHLPAGETLLSIGQLDELQVEADILSLDVVRIRVGDEVRIYGPAVGAAGFQSGADDGVRGVVRRIHPAGFTKVSSLGVEQQRVKVIIDFAPGVLKELHKQRQLGVGYRVRVRVITNRISDALLIPRTALFRGADRRWSVFAIRRGRVVRQVVQVGLMNDERAQILEGIEEDEIVVLAPEGGLTDGDAVTAKLDEE